MTYQVDFKDKVSAAIKTLIQLGVSSAKCHKAIASSVGEFIRRYLIEKNQQPNKRNWPKVGFYGSAAQSMNWDGNDAGATVTISQIGFRQRLQGGPIRPGPGRKFLTIPATAEAYGKRAGEFHNLTVKIVPFLGLCLVESEATQLKKSRKKATKGQLVPDKTVGGKVYFRLVRSVNQKPDPSVLPDDASIVDAGKQGIEDLYEQTWEAST